MKFLRLIIKSWGYKPCLLSESYKYINLFYVKTGTEDLLMPKQVTYISTVMP